jgi:hypothetical protein
MAQSALPRIRAGSKIHPLSKQFCSGEDCGVCPRWAPGSAGLECCPPAEGGLRWRSPPRGSTSRIRNYRQLPIDGTEIVGRPSSQTPGATSHKVSRIRDSGSRVNELQGVPQANSGENCPANADPREAVGAMAPLPVRSLTHGQFPPAELRLSELNSRVHWGL